MAEKFSLKTFKLHFGAYIDKSKESYKSYVYKPLGTEPMEWWSKNTFRGSGCRWIDFKRYVINLGTPASRDEDSAEMVGMWVSMYIWWYVNRFGLTADKKGIKEWMDFLWDKDLITKVQYFLDDREVFDTFDASASLFCFDHIVDEIKPKRSSGDSGSQRGVGSVKQRTKRRK